MWPGRARDKDPHEPSSGSVSLAYWSCFLWWDYFCHYSLYLEYTSWFLDLERESYVREDMTSPSYSYVFMHAQYFGHNVFVPCLCITNMILARLNLCLTKMNPLTDWFTRFQTALPFNHLRHSFISNPKLQVVTLWFVVGCFFAMISAGIILTKCAAVSQRVKFLICYDIACITSWLGASH